MACTEKTVMFQDHFELQRFKKVQYDLYNPILNTFKLDSVARKEHPDFFDYDAYYDDNNMLRYLFFRSESYGYLHELLYNESNQLSKVRIYPILAGSIDKGAQVIYNNYFYVDGQLKVIKDNLDNRLLFVNEDSVTICNGILDLSEDFQITRKKIQEYYIRFLN